MNPLKSIVAVLLFAVVWPGAAAAQQTTIDTSLQRRIANYFAPVLLFHRDEQFYPTEVHTPLGDLSHPTAEDAEALHIDKRVRAYLAMPLADRLRFATVYYRVSHPAGPDSGRRLVIEYFFYYLFNGYGVRGGLFPAGFKTNHFHDFETLMIVVAWPTTPALADWNPATAHVVGIYPSDHGHDVPDNVWRASADQDVSLPVHVIVERGSHAMAADLNQNGIFDPGVDSNQRSKFVWGIRDHGATWARYKTGYMDARQPAKEVELIGGDVPHDGAATASYGLSPVSRLTDGIALVARLAGDAGFGHASWTVRLFGETDPRNIVNVAPVPVDPERGRGDRAAAAYEHGLSVAVSNLLGVVSFYGGGRWLFNGPGRLPDLMFDGQAAVTNDRRFYYMLDSFASYRLDYISRLLVGVSTMAQGRDARDARMDLAAGVEFRLGHLRFRNLARHNTPLHRTWYDLRISYVF